MSLWKTIWASIQKECGRPIPEDIWRKWTTIVEEKYSESQRHYHNLGHVEALCGLLTGHRAHIENTTNVFYAILFHDVVYDPKSSENEENSEEIFQEFAKEAKLEEGSVSSISDMILQTKQHTTDAHTTPGLYGQSDLHYFLDFDMSILGSPPQEYTKYAEDIRKEYIHIPDDQFRKGRAKVENLRKFILEYCHRPIYNRQVLTEFLNTPNIFATKEFRGEYEQLARQNVRAEIQKLEKAS